MAMNHLRRYLEDGVFFCSAELVLDRDHSAPEAESFVREAAVDSEGARVISLTDLPGGSPSLPPEAFVSYVLENGLTPLAHLTAKDANRSAVEGRLHTLARLGVENVLALTGDAQKPDRQGKAKPVFDLDSVLMLWLIEALREGLAFRVGKRDARTTPFDFLAGAVVNPYKPREADQMMQLYKLELKIAAGARFIITQLGFNLRKLFELKQYLNREGMGHVPLVANIYVPTLTIAKMMASGELPGCVVPSALLQRLEKEKKPERLERAALMLAAVRDLGFAGAHIGGFGLTHLDFRRIQARAAEIGSAWRGRIDELVLATPGEFHLLPPAGDGLSDPEGSYCLGAAGQQESPAQALSRTVHEFLIKPGSPGDRFLSPRIRPEVEEAAKGSWRNRFWSRVLAPSSLYRKATLGCVSCGDCIQDHLHYAGCSMRWCYKNLRNGPCGGSRPDGSCEVDASLQCIWNKVYDATRAVGEDPRKFGTTLIPPRDWCLDRTNALANRFAGLDNYCHRQEIGG
jgi:methylenetetrahydrofolate reductase (NADPH)